MTKDANGTGQQMANGYLWCLLFLRFLRQTHFAICIFQNDFRTKVKYAREGRAFVAILDI